MAANGTGEISSFKDVTEMLIDVMGYALYSVVVIAIVVSVAFAVQKLLVKMVRKGLNSTNVGEVTLFTNAAKWVVWFIAASIIGDLVFGVELGGIFTALGVGSLFVSLGLQDLIKNVVSGVQIISDGLFRVGDQIEIGGHRGEVMDVSWRQTVMRDNDGNAHAIPNSLFNTQIAMRRVDSMTYRYELEVEVRPGLDLDKVGEEFERFAKEALMAEGIMQEGLPPQVRFMGSTAYGTKASVRLFIDDIEHRTKGMDLAMRAISRTGYLSDCTNEQ